ncbi:MAG: glycosyltransferase [Chloroflexaceae bacterium]|nr:glycosyltransferase [Chloroflexaceae bacterium]
MQPLVSVVIDNYNYGRFLAQAIESVFAQTYPHWELIVVDDGSTDNSREILAAYAGRVVPLLQSNSGQGAAITAGIRRSRGEIVCLLDADDYYHPQKLEKVVAAFAAHPSWVQIAHGRIVVDGNNHRIGVGPRRYSQGDVRNLLLRWGRYGFGITSSLAYRREVLWQALPIPSRRAAAADTYLGAIIPFYGEVGCINEPLMFYRIHGNNKQARNDNLDYLIQEREDTAAFINQGAARTGLSARFDVNQDLEYRCLKAMERTQGSGLGALNLAWLSLRESLALGRTPPDTLEKILRRSLCVLSPEAGREVLRLGLRGYVRAKSPRRWQPQGDNF